MSKPEPHRIRPTQTIPRAWSFRSRYVAARAWDLRRASWNKRWGRGEGTSSFSSDWNTSRLSSFWLGQEWVSRPTATVLRCPPVLPNRSEGLPKTVLFLSPWPSLLRSFLREEEERRSLAPQRGLGPPRARASLPDQQCVVRCVGRPIRPPAPATYDDGSGN